LNQTIKIGLCGLGTVGSSVLDIIKNNFDEIAARNGVELEITHVGCRRDNHGIDDKNIVVSKNIFDVANDPNIDVLIELIGGCDVSKELILKAIHNGKCVVTANKALIAEHGEEIFLAAEKKGVSVLYEAAVAGGIPIIKSLKEGLSANKINWLAGIINGTGNFILTEMRDKGRMFSDVLEEAQRLGYAEADPTFDVEGVDAAHKLMILSSIAFRLPMQFSKVYCEGFSRIEVVDIEYAQELGYTIKHLGIARHQQNTNAIEVRVHPTLFPNKSLLSGVNGVMNAVMVNGDSVGTTLYYGAGAGGRPTASAVLADVIDIAKRNTGDQSSFSSRYSVAGDYKIVDIEEIESEYYLRLTTSDKPGVMAHVSKILSDFDINIESVIQKEPKSKDEDVSIVLITDVTQEENLNQALIQLHQLSELNGPIVKIRVDQLDLKTV
jgi:homoserine dehydrogenase